MEGYTPRGVHPEGYTSSARFKETKRAFLSRSSTEAMGLFEKQKVFSLSRKLRKRLFSAFPERCPYYTSLKETFRTGY